MSNKQQAATQEPNETDKKFNFMYILMGGVIIVLFTCFVGLVITGVQNRIDSEANKQATYQSLRDQVRDQNAKIESLTSRINALTEAIQDGQRTLQKTN